MKKLTAMLLALIVLLAAAIPALASGMLRTGGEAHECDALCEHDCEHQHDCEHDEAENAEHRTADGEQEEHDPSEHREYEGPEGNDTSEHRESGEPNDYSEVTPEPVELPPYEGEVSEETRKLARLILEQLDKTPLGYSGMSTLEVYELFKEMLIPELAEFESRSDSALALVELFEKHVDELVNDGYDYVASLERIKNSPDDSSFALTDEMEKDVRLRFYEDNIQAMLSFDVYYDRLTDEQRTRLLNAVNTLFKLENSAIAEVYGAGDVPTESTFEKQRYIYKLYFGSEDD